MNEQFLTRRQIHVLLKDRGHTLSSPDSPEGIDVWPPAEMIVTVGLDPDGTLRPAYRQRYFACLRNADDEPLLSHDAAFSLDGRFAALAAFEPGNNDFVMGPLRWLLARLRSFRHVVLWPKGGFRGIDGLDFLLTATGGERIDQAQHLAHWFEVHASEPTRVGAAVLSLENPNDCRALWEAANLVGSKSYDFYLSDVAAKAVYLLHHHDKLVISIPDARSRDDLLAELAELRRFFEDCSGYKSEADAEYGW